MSQLMFNLRTFKKVNKSLDDNQILLTNNTKSLEFQWLSSKKYENQTFQSDSYPRVHESYWRDKYVNGLISPRTCSIWIDEIPPTKSNEQTAGDILYGPEVGGKEEDQDDKVDYKVRTEKRAKQVKRNRSKLWIMSQGIAIPWTRHGIDRQLDELLF